MWPRLVPGGGKAAAKADWTPLKGREVVIWPDADKPGFAYAEHVARLCQDAGAQSIHMVQLPDQLPTSWDLADVPPDEWDNENLRDLLESAARWKPPRESANTGEARPIPFDGHHIPQIDPSLVPEPLYSFCLSVAESIQVPFELALMASIGAVATVAQRKFRVQIKPGYSEPLNLYMLTVLPPGERKSGVVAVCREPLSSWEAEQERTAREQVRAISSERRTLEKAIEAKRRKAGNAPHKKLMDFIEEIKQLEADLPEVPSIPRLLADDFTPEALAEILFKQSERIGLVEAEGGIFEILSGLYSQGVPNLNLVLKAWSGEPVNVDRRGRDSIRLYEPTLTMCLSVQPDVLQQLARKPGFRGRGLLSRFLYCLPQSRLGTRKTDTPPISEVAKAAYATALKRLADTPWSVDGSGHSNESLLALHPGAIEIWRKLANMVEAELGSGGEFESMKDWAGKLPGQVARLAGLFHVVCHDHPETEYVSADTMERAAGLAALLSEHARAAFAVMGTDESTECAKAILRWIEADRVSEFTERDAFRKVRGDHRFKTMAKVRPGLKLLEERLFIFEVPANRSGPGRKPSPLYRSNPLLWELKS